ncbi:MAG TPA: hydantoinase/oxoprolinase N-terminal domain-containing protein [Pseudobdellovibrionaceae bacterium]|nr:hydantoinase/oxoprolinase N-terminal domain-containing protein [Pseudobdellovibrionaceae bacterium]
MHNKGDGLMQVIGMHIGSSFAEVCLMRENSKGQLTQASEPVYLYLPRQTLKSSLPKVLADARIDAAFVTTQFLERLFDFRLGGSTAQVVTSGCENWPFLGSSAAQRGWLHPSKTQPIAARELSFPVEERIDSAGNVVTPMNEASLLAIAEKLKASEIKRVCIHFLNAPANPSHQTRAAEFFKTQGFDVFVPPTCDHLTEAHRWRRSTLEASFSGTFEEIRSDIEKGLEGLVAPDALFFRDRGGFQSPAKTSRVGSLFGLDEILVSHFPKATAVLDLGLESWRLVTRKKQSSWESPWGCIVAQGSARFDLRCQPTSLLEKDSSGDVVIHPKKEGFEPGPLCFGRGQKFLVFDLFSEELQKQEGVKQQMPESGVAKKEFFLNTLCRNSRAKDPAKLVQQLRSDVLESIAWDVQVSAEEGPLVVHGFFASLLGPELRERMPDREIILSTEASASLTAKAGRSPRP